MKQHKNTWDSRYYCAGYGYINRNDESFYPSGRRIKLPKFLIFISPILFLMLVPITNGTISAIIAHSITSKKDKDIAQRVVVEQPNPNPTEYNDGMGGGDDSDLPLKEYYPQEAYLHNKNAKEILDRTASMPDKNIIGLLDKGIRELYKSLSIDDEFGETYYLLGSTFVKMGDHYSSVNNISKAIEAYNASLHNFQKAEDNLYEPYTNIFFERGKVFSVLGAIYQNNDVDRSKEYFFKAIDEYKFCIVHLYPSQNAHFAIADIYYEMGNFQEAIGYYTDALEVNNRSRPTKNDILFKRSNAHYMLGMHYFLNQDYSNAVQSYKESIKDNPENYAAQYELGKTYSFKKMWLESIKQFDLIIEHCPEKNYKGLARTGRDIAFNIFNNLFKEGIYSESEGYEYSWINDRTFRRDKATKKELHEWNGNEWITLCYIY